MGFPALPLVSRCWQNCAKAAAFSHLPQACGNPKDQLGFLKEAPELVGDKEVARTIQGLEDPVGMEGHHERKFPSPLGLSDCLKIIFRQKRGGVQ